MKRLIAILILSICTSAVSFGQDVSKQRAAIKRIENEIAQIDRQLAANRKQQSSNTAELALLNRKISGIEQILGNLNSSIKGYEREIAAKGREIGRISDELDTMKVHYAKLVREAYKIRDSKVWFVYILASKSINEGYRRWKYLQALSVSLKEKTEQLKEKKASLEKARIQLAGLKTEAAAEKEKQQKEYARLSDAKKEAQKTINALAGKEKELKKQINAKRRETEKLNREIERIIEEAVKKAEKQKKQEGKQPAAEVKLSGEFSANKGKLPWPVENGVVVDKFGQHNHPVFTHIKMPYNNGVNISAPSGATVKAVFRGVVKQILVVPGYNQCVLVQHGEYFTFYCKLKSVNVKNGQTIDTGDRIGTADDENGNAILHFEIWKGTVKQNPELWLR